MELAKELATGKTAKEIKAKSRPAEQARPVTTELNAKLDEIVASPVEMAKAVKKVDAIMEDMLATSDEDDFTSDDNPEPSLEDQLNSAITELDLVNDKLRLEKEKNAELENENARLKAENAELTRQVQNTCQT